MLRSGRTPPPLPPATTWVVAVVAVVKFCADRVPVTDAVLLMTVPSEAVTMPRTVTVHDLPPPRTPPEQVTLRFDWEQLPWELVRTSCGGVPIPPTPLT